MGVEVEVEVRGRPTGSDRQEPFKTKEVRIVHYRDRGFGTYGTSDI